ncbi:MAG: c-type cytochrome [Chloroflexi bacterium]|nr:c-type cytochrome [Chloroflexota bacterium]
MSTQQKLLIAIIFALLTCVPLGAIALNDLGRVFGAVSPDERTAMEQRALAYQGRAIETGAELYARHCIKCHGARGEGVPQFAPALSRKDLFDGRRAQEVRWNGGVESLLKNAIAAGRPAQSRPDLYSARMPTFSRDYGGALSASQIDALVAFALNWQANATEVNAWSAIPVPTRAPGAVTQPGTPAAGLARICQSLSAPYAGRKSPYKFDDKTILAQGKQIFDDKCAACHGAVGAGNGPAAAALNPKPANLADKNFMQALPVDCHFFVIAEGVRGTAMPPWKALGDDALWKVLIYTRAWTGVP